MDIWNDPTSRGPEDEPPDPDPEDYYSDMHGESEVLNIISYVQAVQARAGNIDEYTPKQLLENYISEMDGPHIRNISPDD